MSSLLDLPDDLICEILGQSGLGGLAYWSLTCRRIHALLRAHERHLSKKVYLSNLDSPPHGHDIDWVQEVKDLALTLRAYNHESMTRFKYRDRKTIEETIAKLLRNATPAQGVSPLSSSPTHLPSRNVLFLSRLFDKGTWRARFLLLSDIHTPHDEVSRPSNSLFGVEAKYHCLYGQVVTSHGGGISPHGIIYDAHKSYELAEYKVYDLVEYVGSGSWGPFKADGSGAVNWARVEAAMVVLANNTADMGHEMGYLVNAPPFSGSYPNSYCCPFLGRELLPAAIAADPYGITGTWVRVLSSMDPQSFRSFNWPGPVPPVDARDLFDRQSTKHVLMDLKTAEIEIPGPSNAGSLPVVRFTGNAQPMNGVFDENLFFDITGSCRTTPRGDVQWEMTCIFRGRARWRVEAIQIGGVRSGRGAVGSWFPADLDEEGPVGPVAFWKTADIPPGVARSGGRHHHRHFAGEAQNQNELKVPDLEGVRGKVGRLED
ncbi:uncharacterized protein DNG_08695 [Cephalotrichum gorgonifer]|uniref:F-box domain-containing protein n=1 Tax=Cephalotrichum gorgonifer TaxID=2041049 RepID=A0AAE8N420_9PEZI|nr:uncharacterized protein DNG_08695 [Cephalotrichum gorgonifer]